MKPIGNGLYHKQKERKNNLQSIRDQKVGGSELKGKNRFISL